MPAPTKLASLVVFVNVSHQHVFLGQRYVRSFALALLAVRAQCHGLDTIRGRLLEGSGTHVQVAHSGGSAGPAEAVESARCAGAVGAYQAVAPAGPGEAGGGDDAAAATEVRASTSPGGTPSIPVAAVVTTVSPVRVCVCVRLCVSVCVCV